MEPARLVLEPRRVEAGDLTVAARLEHPDGRRLRLWWRLPEAWSDAVTPWADPFVVAFLFPIMKWGRDVAVEGRASPSLLANLETYMAIWHTWEPQTYRPVQITPQEEVESPPPPQPGQTVAPFSGGVDSCFSVYRHRRGLAGRRTLNVQAAVVMDGFDIWPDQPNAAGIYSGLLADARIMLDSLHLPCIPMASNFHELPTRWAHSFGTHLVSGLRLLAGRFDSTFIPNNTPYFELDRPWASHPVSDPFLSSRHFQVADDGAEAVRAQKVRVISQWPEAMRYLRVCFANPHSHANCCRCEKCIRTVLAFRAAGCPVPPALTDDITCRQIRRVRLRNRYWTVRWEQILVHATERGLDRTDWAKAVRVAIRRNRMRIVANRLKRPLIPLRNAIRAVFRGSRLSRSQLAEQSAARRDRHSL